MFVSKTDLHSFVVAEVDLVRACASHLFPNAQKLTPTRLRERLIDCVRKACVQNVLYPRSRKSEGFQSPIISHVCTIIDFADFLILEINICNLQMEQQRMISDITMLLQSYPAKSNHVDKFIALILGLCLDDHAVVSYLKHLTCASFRISFVSSQVYKFADVGNSGIAHNLSNTTRDAVGMFGNFDFMR